MNVGANIRAAACVPKLALLVACLLAVPATAQPVSNLPLQIEVEYPSQVSRTCGPIRLQLVFDWGGPGVLNGDLQLEARDGAFATLGTFVIENLYLTEGRQAYEVMLPGMRVDTRDDAITLTPTLVAKGSGKASRLRDLQVIVPGLDRRKLVVASLKPEPEVGETAKLERRENDITNSLRLERLAPAAFGVPQIPGGGGVGIEAQPAAPQLGAPRIVTASVEWLAADAPQDPLRYCACDILLLPEKGLELVKTPALEAILAWVRAGGGVCVVLDDAQLKRDQIAWLNTLVGAPADKPTFLGDSEGRLIHELDESAGTAQRRMLGLGRVVIAVGPEQAQPSAEHWAQSAAFLWRLRHQHQNSLAQFGTWDHQYTLDVARNAPQLAHTAYGEFEASQNMLAAEFQPLPTLGLNEFIQRLLPDGVRLVPLSTMGGMLLAYLLAIGPLDYFVLGKLGMRKWTWCTFPLITLLFTGFSIGLSNRYMGSSVARRAAVFRDVAPGGHIARENRLELLFPSRTGVMETDVGRGLFTPLQYQEFAQFQVFAYDPRTGQPLGPQVQRSGSAVYYGRMPMQCRVVQGVSQWSPQLNRQLTIPLQLPKDLPDFNWDEVPDFRTEAGLHRLRARINESFGLSVAEQLQHGGDLVSAGVMHGTDSTLLLGEPSNFQKNTLHNVQVVTPYGVQSTHQSSSFLWLLSVGTQPGFLAVASEYAPTGGDRFEDMLMLDPTDPRQWLLVIMQPHGNDYYIYRRLYVLEN